MRTSGGLPRRPDNRWADFDYSDSAAYFITICAATRSPVFGQVEDGRVALSELGRIVDEEWSRTGLLRTDVHLDEHIVMPNHFHATLFVEGGERRTKATRLGHIVGSFKAAVTSRARKLFGSSAAIWHEGFHDRVIRNSSELEIRRNYILRNPERWREDELFPDDEEG